MKREEIHRPKIKKGQITSFTVKNNSIKTKRNNKIKAPILAKFMSKNNSTALPIKKQRTYDAIPEEPDSISKSPSKPKRNASLNNPKKKLKLFDQDNKEEDYQYEQVANFKKRKRNKPN